LREVICYRYVTFHSFPKLDVCFRKVAMDPHPLT
jgi:hypothetical protein